MTERELTPIEREAAAIIEADIRVRLEGQQITPANLKAAAIESVWTLSRPINFPEIVVERDPNDPNRVIISGPGAELMQRLAARYGQ